MTIGWSNWPRPTAASPGSTLEHPDIFPDFHDSFVTYLRESLQPHLPDPLPMIGIPLLPGDPPVSLDLQAVFDRTYEAGPYHREIDYRSTPPAPPLSANLLTWAADKAKQRAES